MTDTNPSIERLDLRFRAAAPKARKSWLPGGAWLWFILGFTAGIVGWNYGRELLQKQLAEQVGPERDPSEALLALEALNLLGDDHEFSLVRALAHPDVRVVRSATRKLNASIDGYMQGQPASSGESIQQLVEQLRNLPNELPEENRLLISGLAARLYADCVRLEQPQLQATADNCLDLFNCLDRKRQASEAMESLVILPPPVVIPLPMAADNIRLTDEPQSPSTASGSVRAILSSSGLPHSNLRVASSIAQSVVTADGQQIDTQPNTQRLSDTADSLADDIPGMESRSETIAASRSEPLEPVMTKNRSQIQPASQERELPVMVATPASISQHPVVRMKLISDQPNLQGIESAEIAELVRLLGSENPDVAKAASLALSHKGFSDFEIELAAELATGSAARRLELVQQIAVSDQVNPRPWLVWMAEDGQPEVRRMSISLLNSMLDEQVQRSLRILMFRETDSEIKDLIRKVLLNKRR